MPTKPIIEPTREVEFASDHQKRRTGADDHQLRGYCQPVEHAIGSEHPGAAGRDAKEGEDENDAGKGAEIRPREEPPPRRMPTQTFVNDVHDRCVVRGIIRQDSHITFSRG